ncbi:hypothetical protein GLOTRDRAFT_127480 [Gloeophyllum trabeum ATCC 11539]|uniref:Histone chaperone domain-containing protein n=1 Tax=Gloeophyllum trabeum (strain ATCC 11539 / FP-39264 / Madison 617) TaxID=670483 RepID=S7QCI9_GLOTA|nr:uncharacterized protein GLOTRDRAFT_127480 [Gloeophyllum trabeum ATCC 11539]EPQ57103.1 hypothetical protein GLOTRDRAFT_127480 [Gloeophyllum trabeum ATCC 11539]
MSTEATSAGQKGASDASVTSPSGDKGKGKFVQPDVEMADDDDDEEDDEEEEEEEEEEEAEEEDSLAEIDPSVILPTGRRTRGVKVDYTSPEALAKAGLKPEDKDEDEEDTFEAKDEEMKD